MSQMPSTPPPPPNAAVGGAKVVIAAIVLAILAVIILSFYIQSVKQQVAEDQITIFVMTRSAAPGDRINDRYWKAVNVPRAFESSFEELRAITNADTLATLERGTRQFEVAVPKGSIITHSMFDETAQGRDIQIDDGMERVAIPVDPRGVPGGLRPGMTIDIAAPMETGGQVRETMVVLEQVRVKSIGSFTLQDSAQGDDRAIRSYNTIGVDVRPNVAVKLSTLKRMMRSYREAEFEVFITPTEGGPRQWPVGEINPKVLELINKHVPAS